MTFTHNNRPFQENSIFGPKDAWDALSMAEKAEMMKVAVKHGIYDLPTIRKKYNEFAEGGDKEELTPWKALDNIDYTAVPDTTFTRDKTGAGSIEVMFKDTPREGYEYGTGYKYPHPMPGHNVVIYNPKDNDAQDIRLDALHIMPQDATYDALRSELAYYADSSDIAGNARGRMEDDIKQYGHLIPGMTYQDYYNNEVDGFLRNMFIEGSPEYIASKRYYPNQQQLREWNKELMPYVDRIHDYLLTGQRPANVLPEVVITGKKHSIGGPLVEAAMNEYKSGGGIHIKPSHRGRLTELKKRTGKSEAELYRTGSPATRKMITFARNARKWKHDDGGNLYYPGGEIKYGRPYYSYDENGRKIDDTLNYNATIPEIVITPDSKKSPAERAILERQRRANQERATGKGTYDAMRDGEWTGLQVLAAQKEWENSAKKKALDYAQSAAMGIGIGADIVSGLPIYSSLKGASTLSRAETPLEYVEGGLWLAPVLGEAYQTTKPIVKQAVQTAIDNGTFWDAYTTFGGRLGNYGDNTLTNIYGTAARRFGLPDKARVPADAIRKIDKNVKIENGVVDLTGEKAFLGNPHTNMALDQPVVSHPKWVGDGADTYLFPTNNVIKNSGEALKSIEPSDMFVNGVRVTEKPQNVTLISGDVDALNYAKENGLQTLSSPKLRRMYNEAVEKYEKDLAAYNKLSLLEKVNQHPPVHPKEASRRQFYWPEYANEVARLQARRGTPTLADFRLLEEQTGLSAGVAPISQYNSVFNQIKGLLNGTNRTFNAPIYPNGREVDLGLDGLMHEFDYLNRANYHKVFYDPASMVESEWQIANGVK